VRRPVRDTLVGGDGSPSTRNHRTLGTVPILDRLAVPVVLAPMAGGPSTPELAAAVTGAGGLGFLAAGYLTTERLAADVAATRRRTDGPLGVNVFAPPAREVDHDAVQAYADRLAAPAARHGVALGEPRHDDDGFGAKVDLLAAAGVDVVSTTFGPPPAAVVERLHGAGVEVWSTVTDRAEADVAVGLGVDAVVAQGAEAGGHQGATVDDDRTPLPLVALLADLAGLAVPVVAAGGIVSGHDVAAALAAGAVAVQAGTAFLLCPEAGTTAVHRAAVAGAAGADDPTVLTRAFSGRRARGLANAWTAEVGADAPIAYPDVHHLTTPLRAHGRAVGDPDLVNLWAGTGVGRVRPAPAADVVASLAPASGPA
jgi:nitronate monooxygenase